MKRWLVWSFVSVATFLVGAFFVYSYLTLTARIEDLKNNSATSHPLSVEPTTSIRVVNEIDSDSRIEYFVDEKKIGRRGKNKIEIRCFSRGSYRYAEMKFYSRTEHNAWVEIQSFKFEKDGVTGCDPIVTDFNNDGLRDFTYQSKVAARGANEVRKLFIYDPNFDELVYIKNSEQYPNLSYNKKLNCVDAFLVYGATSTVFLRIEGDTLREFASVATGTERIVTVTDNSGEQKIIRREKMNPDNFEELFWRFSTYDPPR